MAYQLLEVLVVLLTFKPCETKNVDKWFSMELFFWSVYTVESSQITVSTPHSMQKIHLKTNSNLLLNTSTVKLPVFFSKVKPRSHGLRVSVKYFFTQNTADQQNFTCFFNMDLVWYERM